MLLLLTLFLRQMEISEAEPGFVLLLLLPRLILSHFFK